jgi:hypothetical protein
VRMTMSRHPHREEADPGQEINLSWPEDTTGIVEPERVKPVSRGKRGRKNSCEPSYSKPRENVFARYTLL